MQIRLMKKSDIEEVAQIERETFSMPWSQRAFLQSLEMEHVLFLVAEKENEIAGYIGVYFAADEAEITNVAVKEKFRRRHIGESLVKEMVLRAKERGAVFAFLEVRCSNAEAIALYEKMGFSICGSRKGFYEKPREDAYVMVFAPDISTIQAGS
ncbi:MAG: ribosomal protein S18-alanine N-acetyltransferase [Lachnospiraceae bacterium]|jgi:ribosomal-protein-alanine N-acetyltransferase|nr:ribosomal protein S18-alanine N-acetyltransferase [Lachnospiraceae bacterium]